MIPVSEQFAALGPEPLGPEFTVDYLVAATANRAVPIKQVLMDNHVVVGVGNIYAAESLFRAGIDPRRAAKRKSPAFGPVAYSDPGYFTGGNCGWWLDD